MPDANNRYSLLELRQYVLRNLASLRVQTVDPVTGAESGTTYLGLNAQFSQQLLNQRINSSLTKTWLLVSAENDTLFRKEVFFDAAPNVLQYRIPPDALDINGLWWKDASIQAPAKPDDYRIMSYQEQLEGAKGFGGQQGRPTWRRVGNFVQLNRDPGDFSTAINVQGIWFKYTRWNRFLINDTDYIDHNYAQIMQEVVVYDTTMECIKTQDEMVDASGIQASLAYWNQQLEILVRNAYRPPEIELRGPAHHYLTFSGRRTFSR